MKTANIGGKPIKLNDGEKVIWQGRPTQGIIRNPAHIGWGIAALSLGFWLFSDGNAVTGTLLVILGVYLTYFHAIVEKNRRAATYYALTNQRAILAYSLRVLAYPILPSSQFKLKKGRYDTVLFAEEPPTGRAMGYSQKGFGFGHLKNGDDVYNLILGVQSSLGKNN